MEYSNCPLYKLNSKRLLKHLLGIKNNNMLKQSYIITQINPYIEYKSKPRLIEPPSYELKLIQRRLKNLLGRIEIPKNILSGVKGRSYVKNAEAHAGNSLRRLFKIDLKAFFPSINRDTVYKFFKYDLLCSADIAEILTNLTTVDVSKTLVKNKETIYEFLKSKFVRGTNHLISGAPTSQILSYLVNHKMFDEMQRLSDQYQIIMTVYVDDVIFSSECNISRDFRERIYSIIKKYNYKLSKNKIETYTRAYPKVVTGVVIDSRGNLKIRNSMKYRIANIHRYVRAHPDDIENLQRLRGLLVAARQVEKNAFPLIYHYAFIEQKTAKM